MKPQSWRKGIPLYQSVYARHAAGCCMHVQCDDGNLSDHFFDAESRQYVIKGGHVDCLGLFDLMATMSITQRKKLYSNWDKGGHKNAAGFQLENVPLKLPVNKFTAVALGAVLETTSRAPKNPITCCEKHRQAYQRLIDDKEPKRPIFHVYDDCFTDPPRTESLQIK